MRAVSVSFQSALADLAAGELAVLSDVLGVFLGYQEPWDQSQIEKRRSALNALYASINQTPAKIGEEDVRLSGPFQTGERVVWVGFDAPDSETTRFGTVITQHSHDRRHDYDWCHIRFYSGQEQELPMDELRRFEPSHSDS